MVRSLGGVRRDVRLHLDAHGQEAGADRDQGVLQRVHHRRPRHRGDGHRGDRQRVRDGRNFGSPDGVPEVGVPLGPGGAEDGRRGVHRQARRLTVRLLDGVGDGAGPARPVGRLRGAQLTRQPLPRGERHQPELHPADPQGPARLGGRVAVQARGVPRGQPLLRRGRGRPGRGPSLGGLPVPQVHVWRGVARERGGPVRAARRLHQAGPQAVHDRLRPQRVRLQPLGRGRVAAEDRHPARRRAGHRAQEQLVQAGQVGLAVGGGGGGPGQDRLREPGQADRQAQPRDLGDAVLQAARPRDQHHAAADQHLGDHQDARGQVPRARGRQVRFDAGPEQARRAHLLRPAQHLRGRLRGGGGGRRGRRR
mmetsp:Transcript_11894/g.27885  ORF Transcript_11894/g.27885 Transcript_11894/m.27885 type:complete len:365 (-) Transcript_11894:243-1337(-)